MTQKHIAIIGLSFMMSSFLFMHAACRKKPSPEGVIIDKYIEAIGGRANLDKIQNKKIQAVVKVPAFDMGMTDIIYQERPNKYYQESDLGGTGKTLAGTDGSVVWEISPVTGARVLTGPEAARKLIAYAFDGPLVSWKTYFANIRAAGMAHVNGKSCHRLILTPKEGTDMTYYFDEDTGLIVKMVTQGQSPQGNMAVEILLDDYREVGGVLYAHQYKGVGMRREIFSTVYEKIETNIDMPENRFDLPGSIQTIIDGSSGP